jgi:hypothetical protein
MLMRLFERIQDRKQRSPRFTDERKPFQSEVGPQFLEIGT